MTKRLYRVDVEIEFDSTDTDVLVWAEDEGEAEEIAKEWAEDQSHEPDGEHVSASVREECSKEDVASAQRREEYVASDDDSFSWTTAAKEATEEDEARAAWAGQHVLPGMDPPPLPERCESCGRRPPLSPHADDCTAGKETST